MNTSKADTPRPHHHRPYCAAIRWSAIAVFSIVTTSAAAEPTVSAEFAQMLQSIQQELGKLKNSGTRGANVPGRSCAYTAVRNASHAIQTDQIEKAVNAVVIEPLKTGGDLALTLTGIGGVTALAWDAVKCGIDSKDADDPEASFARCMLGTVLTSTVKTKLAEKSIDPDDFDTEVLGELQDAVEDAKLFETIDTYQGQPERFEFSIEHNNCDSQIDAVWRRKPHRGARGGYIDLTVKSFCTCPGGDGYDNSAEADTAKEETGPPFKLRTGYLHVRGIPVKYGKRNADGPTWQVSSVLNAKGMRFFAYCCGSSGGIFNNRSYQLFKHSNGTFTSNNASPLKSIGSASQSSSSSAGQGQSLLDTYGAIDEQRSASKSDYANLQFADPLNPVGIASTPTPGISAVPASGSATNGLVQIGEPAAYCDTGGMIELRDVDNDGILDAVEIDHFYSQLAVRLGADALQRLPSAIYEVGANPSVVKLRDLNQDGLTDIVVANLAADSVSVLLGIGHGVFEDESRLNVGEEPSALYLVDGDRDGFVDIVTYNRYSGDVSFLRGDGNGDFESEQRHGASIRFQGLKVVEATGDVRLFGIGEAGEVVPVPLAATPAPRFDPGAIIQAPTSARASAFPPTFIKVKP